MPANEYDLNDNVGLENSHILPAPIRELAKFVWQVVEFKDEQICDSSKLGVTPKKLMDELRVNKQGWKSFVSSEDGNAVTYRNYFC